MVKSSGRIHALDRCHTGGVAYYVWALPPKIGGTAQRYQQEIGPCVGTCDLVCRRGAAGQQEKVTYDQGTGEAGRPVEREVSKNLW